MENVNTLDIDGTQWEMMDAQARQDIATLKSSQEIILYARVELSLRPGYTASDAKLLSVSRMGKLIFGAIRITNLAGEGVGNDRVLDIADMPFTPATYYECVAVDMKANTSYRMQIFGDGRITIVSTGKLKNGDSELTAPFIIFEK